MTIRLVARVRMFILDIVIAFLIIGSHDPAISARTRLQAAGPGLDKAAALWRLNRRRAKLSTLDAEVGK